MLRALVRLRENTYGVTIRREIAERTVTRRSAGWSTPPSSGWSERATFRRGWGNRRRSGAVERSGIFGLRRQEEGR